jgi:Mg-chelatase subunit ChlD
MQPSALFLPGWGAPAALYEPGLPDAWRALEPPSFAASGGSLEAYRRWLGVELSRAGRSPLGGHSMGAALAILAAAARALAAVARAPRAAFALAEEVRALDLRRECARVRAAGIPVLVVGCSTDTLVTRGHSQALADALGAEYRELTLAGGHMWMLRAHELLARVLS